jgi:hypothetical protein
MDSSLVVSEVIGSIAARVRSHSARAVAPDYDLEFRSVLSSAAPYSLDISCDDIEAAVRADDGDFSPSVVQVLAELRQLWPAWIAEERAKLSPPTPAQGSTR